MSNKQTWWMRDAANSICGQTGAKTHQGKLHQAADSFDMMLAALKHAAQNMPHPDQMIDDAIAAAEAE